MEKISVAHATYFKNVNIAPIFIDANQARIRYTGFAKQHKIIEQPILGFYYKALELSGAKRVVVRFTKPVSDEEFAEVAAEWA